MCKAVLKRSQEHVGVQPDVQFAAPIRLKSRFITLEKAKAAMGYIKFAGGVKAAARAESLAPHADPPHT